MGGFTFAFVQFLWQSQGRRQPSTLCSASGDSTDNESDFDVDDRRPRLGVRSAIAERGSVISVDTDIKMPEPMAEHRSGMALNCEEAPLDVDIKNGGKIVVLNTQNLPLVCEVGLGDYLVRLNGSAMCSLGFSCDFALQVTYIFRAVAILRLSLISIKRLMTLD
ncbi:glutelin type-B 5-like [Olea europaea subsp. europaea]|uniref:Glutelin type-B 5-like n=1 Tax=Olea europaea subsp. europaea TaxID=158383 RepID=A0A8S0T736_OLEEU|nr:glutelin type-B 5-like [Olea europaea subsp. europaea]